MNNTIAISHKNSIRLKVINYHENKYKPIEISKLVGITRQEATRLINTQLFAEKRGKKRKFTPAELDFIKSYYIKHSNLHIKK